MMHRCLKICVLSVCVAVSCGGRAFGGYFLCKVCKEPISDEDWGVTMLSSNMAIRCPKCLFATGAMLIRMVYRNACAIITRRNVFSPSKTKKTKVSTNSFLLLRSMWSRSIVFGNILFGVRNAKSKSA